MNVQKRNQTASLLILLFSSIMFENIAFGETYTPYLYQRSGNGEGGSVKVELETAVGTREARPFGEEGLEQGVRLKYNPIERLSLEAFGGALFNDNKYENKSFSGEINFAVLKETMQFINLSIGVGYLLDYQSVSVPRIRISANKNLGDFNIAVSSLSEIPLAEDRDAMDLILSTAASYAFVDGGRIGVEVMGEDLEGFWEKEEAEGGAKIVFGPTVWFLFARNFELKANAGGIIPATSNQPLRIEPGVSNYANSSGFLFRIALGYNF